MISDVFGLRIICTGVAAPACSTTCAHSRLEECLEEVKNQFLHNILHSEGVKPSWKSVVRHKSGGVYVLNNLHHLMHSKLESLDSVKIPLV